MGDERKKVPVGDNKKIFTKTRGDFNGDKIIGRDPHVSPSDFLRMTIFKIGRPLDDCLRNRGMTVNNKYRNLGMTVNKNWRNRGVTVKKYVRKREGDNK